MLTIILATFLGIVFTLVAVENSQVVQLNILGSVIALPFYIVLAISFLLGTFITSIFSIFDWTFTAFDLKKKENSYDNAIRINDTLRKDIQKLEVENARLKEEVNQVKIAYSERKNLQRKESIKNFFHRITHPNTTTQTHLT